MTINIPDNIAERVIRHAHNRRTTPEKLVARYITERLPAHVVETAVCCGCGKVFRVYKGRGLYCSAECYHAAPFPRLGIRLQEIQQYYGCTIAAAAAGLGVSEGHMRRVVKRLGIRDRFIGR